MTPDERWNVVMEHIQRGVIETDDWRCPPRTRPGKCWQCYSTSNDPYATIHGEPAHRFVFKAYFPERNIDGKHLHHECENKRCVNPAHVRPLLPGDHGRIHAAWSHLRVPVSQ